MRAPALRTPLLRFLRNLRDLHSAVFHLKMLKLVLGKVLLGAILLSDQRH